MTALVPLDRTGMAAFVPHTPFKRACSQCGGPATCMCDYRPGAGGGMPCDRLLCDNCSSSPAPGKHHCHQHARIWKFRADMHAKAQEQRTA